MPSKAGTEKSSEQKNRSKNDLKMAQAVESHDAPKSDVPWETSLLEVYGTNVSLSHPCLESGAVTTDYQLSAAALPLQKGVTITPGGAFGQVAAYDDKSTGVRSVIFNAAGGTLDFAPPNLNGVRATGSLAVATIVTDQLSDASGPKAEDAPVMDHISLPPLDQAALEMQPAEAGGMALEEAAPLGQRSKTAETAEASAYLTEPMVIEPIEGFRLKLGGMEYVRRKNEWNPKLKFYQSSLTYQGKPAAPDFQTESDESGLHLSGGGTVPLDAELLADSGFAAAQEAHAGIELCLDQDGARIALRPVSQEEAEQIPEEAEQVPEEAEPAQEEVQPVQEEAAPVTEKAEPVPEESRRAVPKPEGDLLTDDGYLRLEDPQYPSQEEWDGETPLHGTGGFRFLSIPYDITIPGRGADSHLTGVTREKAEHEGEMDFDLRSGKLNAKFDVPVELSLLDEGAPEALTCTLTLMNAAVENGVLTAKSVRLDRGLEVETETETAKKLFGESLQVTIADVGGTAEVNRGTGITGETGGKQLGAFSVSNFLDFLDISGDYAAGRLHAGLHAKEEDEREHSKSLFGESRHLTDAGLSIPIAGPLSFELAVGTSLELGGELSADLARNPAKSFGERMEPGEAMELGGGLKLEGSAAVNVSAGLSVGISALVTNLLAADIKLTAELAAEFETALTGGTALGKEDGKLKQVRDLRLGGDLDVTLKGALNLSSDVKFLIWNANIFTMELGKKEIPLAQASGTVTREAGAKGLKNGWHFESLDLSAEAFGKKAGLALKNQGEAKREPVRISRAAVDAIGSDAKNAWAVLEDLKQQQTLNGERAYFLSEKEQEDLKKKIRDMSDTAEDKLREYMSWLGSYKAQLETDESRAREAVEAARRRRSEYQQKDEVRGLLLRQSRIGGFDPENYRNTPEQAPLSEEEMARIRAESDSAFKANSQIRAENRERERGNRDIREQNRQRNKMSAVDLAIARQLGIYDDAMAQVRDAYDVFAQAQNLKLKAKDKNLPEEKLLRRGSALTERELLSGNTETDWGDSSVQLLEAKTRFGEGDQNYFHVLHSRALNEAEGRVRKGFGSVYRKAFRVHSDPGSSEKSQIVNMSGYELLKIILTDTYPKGACDEDGNDRSGQKMGGTPDQKLEALTYLFKLQDRKGLDSLLDRLLTDYETKKTQQEAMLDNTNEVYRALFDSTLQKMTAEGDVNIPQKLDELSRDLEESKQTYLRTVQEELDVQATIKKVQTEREDCLNKLNKLKKDVKAGVKLTGESVAGATGAVDFMEKDYREIISGKRLLEAASENSGAQEAMRRGGATEAAV